VPPHPSSRGNFPVDSHRGWAVFQCPPSPSPQGYFASFACYFMAPRKKININILFLAWLSLSVEAWYLLEKGVFRRACQKVYWEFAFVLVSSTLITLFYIFVSVRRKIDVLGVFDIFLFQEFTINDCFQF